MSEREPVVEEHRMPPGKAIAVHERCASDAAARKADATEAGVRETGTRKTAAHSAKAVSAEAMSTKTMSTKTMAAKSSMAATTAVTSSPSRRHISGGTGDESRRGGQRDQCFAHREISVG
jgi:hypothetical protein